VAKLINISFVKVVKVGSATSYSFENCEAIIANFKLLKIIWAQSNRVIQSRMFTIHDSLVES
jgi:hypothetical protein